MENKNRYKVTSIEHPNTPRSVIDNMSEVRSFSTRELTNLKIVHGGDEGTEHLRVFRDLRTQLVKHAQGKNFVCLVTSAAPGGGSYVAANLAATIALDRAKTSLFLDCNLYDPFGENLLPVPAHLGLTDYIDDPSISTSEVVYASGIPRVRVVPVGNNREGGTEKINSLRMREFFHEIKTRYPDRYTIVDAPSAAEYDAEIRILADLCDFVLLVVPYGKVTDVEVQSAIDKIGAEKIAGVVFNRG